jgi:hypothetical protein
LPTSALDVHEAVDGHVIGGQTQPGNRGVVANLDIDIISARLEEERVARGIELARGQCLHLGDRIHRDLNRVGGHARVKYGHVRSEIGLNRVNQTERSKNERITEKSPGRNFHEGGEVSAVGFCL